jgi:hypothetical protein
MGLESPIVYIGTLASTATPRLHDDHARLANA